MQAGCTAVESLKRGSQSNYAIDLDEDDEQYDPITKKIQCYFGKIGIYLDNSQLRLQLQMKEQPTSLEQEEIQMMDRNEYQLTQPIILYIKNGCLTDPLRRVFQNINNLAKYLVQYIANNKYVSVDAEKLTLNAHEAQNNQSLVAEIYYNYFKRMNKQDLMRSIRKINNTYKDVNMDFYDPDILKLAPGLLEQQLLDLYRGENDSDSSFSSSGGDSQSNENKNKSSEDQTSDVNQNGPKDRISFASQLQPNFQLNNQDQQPQMPKGGFKQNQIPIYERFRGVDINIPRKEKIKLAQKMLRIGYSKQEIIRFFGGGADEMEAEGNRLPDYRNPASSRYKQIHMIVAKKQHQRHNQLLKRYSMPPVSELQEYAGQIVTAEKRIRQRRIKELLILFVREKKFKKIDQIRDEMRNRGEDVSLLELRRIVMQLKKKSQEKQEQDRNRSQNGYE